MTCVEGYADGTNPWEADVVKKYCLSLRISYTRILFIHELLLLNMLLVDHSASRPYLFSVAYFIVCQVIVAVTHYRSCALVI